MKATLLDDDAFRVLAIPFGGPIPSPTAPHGVDLEGEWFSVRTDIKPDWFRKREVDFHHGWDHEAKAIAAEMGVPYKPVMGRTLIGEATDLELDEDEGWWVKVWLRAGEKRLKLVKALADHGARLFGSSQPIARLVRTGKAGHIDVWPYWRQTLSTAPVNTYSRIMPLKASLDAMMAGGYYPSEAFWQEVLDSLHDLQPDLVRAQAGRTDGRALSEALGAADAQVSRLLALFERAEGGHSDVRGERL
jgi:hypothetical protein